MPSPAAEKPSRDGVDEQMVVCPDRAAQHDRFRVVVSAPVVVRERMERTPAGTLAEALLHAATEWSRQVRGHLGLR